MQKTKEVFMMEKNKKMQRKVISILVLSIVAFVIEVAALA